jgi:hypothetical protein
MRSILMRLPTTIMVLMAIAQAPQAFAAQAQAQEIVSDLPEERRVVDGEAPAAAPQQAPQIDPNATYRLTSDYLATVITSGPGRSLGVSKSGDNYVVVMADTKESPE